MSVLTTVLVGIEQRFEDVYRLRDLSASALVVCKRNSGPWLLQRHLMRLRTDHHQIDALNSITGIAVYTKHRVKCS